MDPTTPGCRGLYLGYHVSCQAVLEDNSYTYFVSLTTYSFWNHSKFSVGNVYAPTKKHSLQVRYAPFRSFRMASESHYSSIYSP